MPKQDFFAFCTSLKAVELKAIGALSRVEHLPAGAAIYGTGDTGDTLYIINRGVVEIVDEVVGGVKSAAFLSRGDIFGAVEALAELPRRNSARAREAVSVQAFRREEFPELLQRVPAFFRFLSTELATRLADAPLVVAPTAQTLHLSGSLANFDLVTIYQTIVNSSQTGELSIRSDAGDVISTFRFESGQPRTGVYDHLAGEEAFWQLFLAERIPGTFSFVSADPNSATANTEPQITRAPSEMLIHALHRRDEFQTLKRELPAHSRLERQKPHLAVDHISSPALRPLVEQIWRFADKRHVGLRSLYPRFEVCELKIYQAVSTLLRSGHFALCDRALADKVA